MAPIQILKPNTSFGNQYQNLVLVLDKKQLKAYEAAQRKVEVLREGHNFFAKSTPLDLTYVVTVKSTVAILQNFVAFSEYMNLNYESFLRKRTLTVHKNR